jgi:hypothetical protein
VRRECNAGAASGENRRLRSAPNNSVTGVGRGGIYLVRSVISSYRHLLLPLTGPPSLFASSLPESAQDRAFLQRLGLEQSTDWIPYAWAEE